MSPSEDELRSALRQGQDDSGPDVAAIVAAGRSARARRRTLASAAAAAVVVAGVGVIGATTLGGHGRAGGNDSTTADGAAAAAGGSTAESRRQEFGSSPGSAAASVVPRLPSQPYCPSALPTLMLPGGGGTGQFGAAGKLFATAPSTVVVCRYDDGVRVDAEVRLAPGRSAELVTDLESASYTLAPRTCAGSSGLPRLAIVGLSASGGTLPVITADAAQPSCGYKVTNGTAVRYEWQLPADVTAALDSAESGAPTSRVPGPQVSLPVVSPGSGRNQGSPVR